MFWTDKYVNEIRERFQEKINSGKPLIIRDEKTASGRIHIGSLRGVAIHGLIFEALKEIGIKNEFFFEINDFDPMDSLPVYFDKKIYGKYMGQPLYTIPSPDNRAENYAEYFSQEFIGVISELGFKPTYYRLSKFYKEGKFNELIRLVLENSDKIREIYKQVSGSVKPRDWMPFNVICEKCGKIGTTQVISFDGKEVEYLCRDDMVEWAKGCGYKGKISPFNGNGKLPWKVEWAAKFVVLGVDIEGAGKDHSTKGGSRDIAEAICREVFKMEPPLNIPYEFVHVAGKKMSSSKGEGSSSREMADLLPPEILRLLLISKNPKQVIDFVPDGDTVPILFDNYDKFSENYFSGANDDFARTFALCHPENERKNIKKRFLPRFSQIAFLVQMPHMNLKTEVERMKESALTDLDIKELERRARYAEFWLKTYAPEDYKYELQKVLPEAAKNLSEKQKTALKEILEYIKSQEILDGQNLHTKLHEIKQKVNIDPRELFSAIYLIFLGKKSGPKVGWFLSVLDREFIQKRLEEAISQGIINSKDDKDNPENIKNGKDGLGDDVAIGINYAEAQNLLNKYITNRMTKLHSMETEAIMRSLAKHFNKNEEKWGIIGLLHDIDWDLTKENPSEHGLIMQNILRDAGATEFLVETIVSHIYEEPNFNVFKGKKRISKLQYLLAAAETSTGLIAAAALMTPDKKLNSLKIESLLKRFKEKKFAANCDRKIILECEKAGISREEFLKIGLEALQRISDKIEF